MLRVAIPNKGQLSEPAREILAEAGYLRGATTRELVVHDPDNDVEFFFLRPRDIAIYVGSGTLDLGITGLDMVEEKRINGEIVMLHEALGFGHCSLVIAVPEGWKSWVYERDNECAGYITKPVVRGRFLLVASPL